MKVHIDFRPTSFDADVTIYTPPPDGTVIHELDGSVRERLAPGDPKTPPPTTQINQEVLELIVAEASEHLPPSSAQERHLVDAIGVRDRLMEAFLPQPGGPEVSGA